MSENRAVPEGWVERTLGEVIASGDFQIKNNLREPIASNIRAQKQGIYPYYGAASAIDFINDYKIDGFHLLIAEDGTVTSNGINPMLQLVDGKFNVSNHTHILQGKEKWKTKFLFYLLSNLNINPYITGAVQPKLNKENLLSIQFLFSTNSTEQQAIVRMLSGFDDKIELLREQNETLEKTAKTIFQEWFGKYSPERPEELPEGWRVGNLTEIAHFLNGIALQKYPPENETDYLPVIKIRELKAGITDQTDKASKNIDSKYIVDTGDILFSWSGSLEVVIWQFGKGALNQHLFKVSSENYPKWFYFHWTLFHLPEFRGIASNKATTMGHIQRHHIEQAMIIIPNKQKFDEMNRVFEPILEKIMLVNSQIQSLSTARDVLLPKLMSGEVRI